MKFFDWRANFAGLLSRLLSAIISVLIAVALWYVINIRDQLDTQIEMTINYYGVPQNLIVTAGLINKVNVRIRGPETLVRSIPQHRLVHAVNLSGITKGETIVPLSGENLGSEFRAFDLLDIQPSRIVVHADNLIEKSVPLQVKINSPLKGGALTVENVSIAPAAVVLRGPESVVQNIDKIPLPIMLDPIATGTTVQQSVTLDTPSLVTASPPSVKVQYNITSGRTVVARRCKVELSVQNARAYRVDPGEITLLVEVPDALAKDARYLSQMQVSVTPPDLEPGESQNVRLRFSLPAGMTLLRPTIQEVQLTYQAMQ